MVRENEHFSAKERARRGRTPLQFLKILVPLDFSECSQQGLNYAIGVAREFRSSLVLFHAVVLPSYALGDEYTALEVPRIRAQQEEYAEKEMARLRQVVAVGLKNVEMRLAAGWPVEQIDQCVRAEGVDLIITSTHGRSGVKRFFIGSTAEQIVRHASCPVLVVPNRVSAKRPAARK
ncbi:MAG: universal stress protein [Chthoniobacterales bacterium]